MKITHLTQAKDFAIVLESGDRVRGKAFCLYILREKGGKGLQAGLIIPKKLAPLAVQRNYIRRLVYAFLRESTSKEIKDGIKIAVRLTENIRGAKKAALSEALKSDLAALLVKAGIR